MTYPVYIAFRRNAPGWTPRLIRWRTSSPYSHVEMVLPFGGIPFCYSAYEEDGGVRRKVIDVFNSPDWDVYFLPGVNAEAVEALFARTKGAPYDWKGVLLGQLFGIKREHPEAYFCSEWCAEAIGLDEPWRHSPGSLFQVVRLIGVPAAPPGAPDAPAAALQPAGAE